MNIPIEKIEEVTGYKVKRNFVSQGLDIAERTGICDITVDEENAFLNFGFIEFDKSDIKQVYKDMFDVLNESIGHQNVVVIEDSFLQRFGKFVQADVFKKLTRFGSIALTICLQRNIPYEFILAKSARAKVKIKMIAGKPKESVADWLKEKFNIDLMGDDDACDAIVLALLGILEGMDFRSQVAIAKAKKKAVKKKAKKK